MKYYPAFLNLHGKKVVVVGGGKVADRKIRTIVRSGADVTVVSPAITSGIQGLKDKDELVHVEREYRSGDLNGAFMVFACTSSDELNARIARDADNLVNVIDGPSEGNFIVPSVAKQGRLTIAISTEGASPAVSKAVRREIEKKYDKTFAHYLDFVEEVRQKALEVITNATEREKFLKSLASEEYLKSLRQEGFEKTSKKILAVLDQVQGQS